MSDSYDDYETAIQLAEHAWEQALEKKQEPVAWISEGGDVSRSKRYMDEMGFKCNPLYTAPSKQWVGLTAYEIQEIHSGNQHWGDFACAIEAKLREKNHG
jgi:hypothetical protein